MEKGLDKIPNRYVVELNELNEDNNEIKSRKFSKYGYTAKDFIIRNSYFRNVQFVFADGYIKFENCTFDGEVTILNKGRMGFDAIEIVTSKSAPTSKLVDLRAQSVEILQSDFVTVDNLIIDAVSVDINMSNIMAQGEINYSGYLNLCDSDLDLVDLKNVSKEAKKAAINIMHSKIDGEDKEFNNIREVLNK